MIEELDEKKKETLKLTWVKVNKSVVNFSLEASFTFSSVNTNHCFE